MSEFVEALRSPCVHLGPDNVLWGTDSLWHGTPQAQIDAFRAFEIPAELQERHGHPALTRELKARILGLNAARVYGIDPAVARCAITEDASPSTRLSTPRPPRPVPARSARVPAATSSPMIRRELALRDALIR